MNHKHSQPRTHTGAGLDVMVTEADGPGRLLGHARRWVLHGLSCTERRAEPAARRRQRRQFGGCNARARGSAETQGHLPNSGFAAAALQFGTYDLSAQTPAGRAIADEYFIQAYAGHVKDRTYPDVSPIYADLHGLPPALLVVGGADVLLEDNLAMAGRLAAAGNDGELRVYPESPHGFTGHPTAIAKTALNDITSWLDARFEPGITG